MQGKEEDEGILSYVEDDDAVMCGYAHRTFAVIFLECYKNGRIVFLLYLLDTLSVDRMNNPNS